MGVGTLEIFASAGRIVSNHLRDRRLKAIAIVVLIWGSISLLHWQPQTQWILWAVTLIFSLQATRLLLANPQLKAIPQPALDWDYPAVSILIPARDESAVLSPLVGNLFALNYRRDRLDVWIVDDGSRDRTPELLQELGREFPSLQVLRREAKGGKSGALNAVLPFLRGEILLICDADARLDSNFLERTIPLFQNPAIGAVQARKTIYNSTTNWLTRCQQMEMTCDSFLQTHRIAIAGVTELRGNGMFVRRELIERCNGWNEDTLTDDLDLTFQLYLQGTEIIFLTEPTVAEEGVTTAKQLWRQRARWAEGGYQRYLDYFPQFLFLSGKKEIDLLFFLLLQFLLPIGLIPDLLWTIFYSHRPVLWPLQNLLGLVLTIAMAAGLYRVEKLRGLALLRETTLGSLYMLHWIPIMLVATFKFCINPKKSAWIKTEHSTGAEENVCG